MKNNIIIVALWFLSAYCSNTKQLSSNSSSLYRQLDSLIDHKQFFSARQIFEKHNRELNSFHHLLISSRINNVFNRLEASSRQIDSIFTFYQQHLNDSMRYQLSDVQHSNFSKLHLYSQALKVCNEIIDRYSYFLSPKQVEDYKNTRIIWMALANTPRQKVIINQQLSVKMTKDKAGLKNLPVSNGKDSLGFIFDTGANISTVSESTARRLGMHFMDSTLLVTSITGKKVPSQLAVCDKLYIRDIEINNAVFLVFRNQDLFIPQISYQINGIIGFPIINDLGEVHISRQDDFIVPLTESVSIPSNMALEFLTPIIDINGEPYTFDTGADETMLYPPYYKKHRDQIDRLYTPTSMRFGGAGGSTTQKGFKVNFNCLVSGKNIQLDSVSLFTEPFKDNMNYYYGNIGQDLIGQFNKMVLNFKSMFIRFE